MFREFENQGDGDFFPPVELVGEIPPDLIREHRLIGPLLMRADELWRQTEETFDSIKARQELMVEKYFSQGLFIPRRVIPALKVEEVLSTIYRATQNSDCFVGLRTAYSSSATIGTTPWVMQTSQESHEEFFERACRKYQGWVSSDNIEVPEAVIVMENPLGVGEKTLAKRCFIVRVLVDPERFAGIIEGRPWTDQTRDLEETIIKDGRRIPNPNFDPKKMFRGNFQFELTPYSISTSDFTLSQQFLKHTDRKTEELIQNVENFFKQKLNFSLFLAHLIALYYVSRHSTVQFQGRVNSGGNHSPYFDFLLGYNIRGAEEYDLGMKAKQKYEPVYCGSKLLPWQRPFYE